MVIIKKYVQYKVMTIPDETHNSEDLETTITFIIKKWKQKATQKRASDTQLYHTLAPILTTGTKSFILSSTEILKITMKPEATELHQCTTRVN